ncbi:hypothetical protein DCC24_11575 [Auritidibacter sp. NML100628]|nr:hypothetical protein DCC24_11575 [Auritidibacter sp. NML100628]
MPFYPVPVAESDSYDVPPAYQYEPEQPARSDKATHQKRWSQVTSHDLPASLHHRKQFPDSSFTPGAPEPIIDFPEPANPELIILQRSNKGDKTVRVLLDGPTGGLTTRLATPSITTTLLAQTHIEKRVLMFCDVVEPYG